MNIVGNDVSEFQGTIDWNTFKDNANFAIIRSSYGDGFTDKQFFQNRNEARRVGLPHGFYHYCYPEDNTPEAEAAWFLSQIGTLQAGEILCLDYEEHYTGDPVAWCKTWLDVVQKATGVKPFIYLNQSLATSYDWTIVAGSDYALWIAAYTYDPTLNNFQLGKFPYASMQQWTDKQQVPGITGAVDGDVFFGDAATFQKYGYVPVPVPPPPAPVPTPVPVPPAPQPVPTPPDRLGQLEAIIKSKWGWFGTNGWQNKLKQLRAI